MPRKTSADALASFIRLQNADTLASILIELAANHPAVNDRLARLQLSNQPKALSQGFRKTLTAWRRSTKYLGYSHAGEFGRELEAWLEQIERELMPQDPAAALALAEAFIEADDVFFNSADDSNGAVGDALRAGCLLWLKAASRCESPATAWPGRIVALVAADQYGPREELLRRADLLLSEEAMRGLVAWHEAHLDDELARPASSAANINWPAARASTVLHLLAEALRDPDIAVRAVLKRSPSPNPVQKASFVEAYLKYGRPESALPWLNGSWAHMEVSRQHLEAQVLTALGRKDEAAVVRRRIFEASLAVSDLHAWLDLLLPHQQSEPIEHARTLATAHPDPVVVALLLMDIGDARAAEAALTSAHGAIEGRNYGTLVPLAEALEHEGLWAGATVVYRALLVAILDRGYAPAYRHGAKYWVRLQGLAQQCAGLMSLESSDEFGARLRVQHKRKTSFWAHVSGVGRADDDNQADAVA